jgi:hypothetical protein
MKSAFPTLAVSIYDSSLLTPRIIGPRSVRRNTVLKTRPDRTEKSGDPVRGCCYLAISEGESETEIGLYKVFY